jgi:ActR/RegA family two-component response regulator
MLDMNYRIGFEDGREGIHWLKEIKPISKVIVLLTAFGKIETAVEGMKIGALYFKTWDNEITLHYR